MTTAGVMDLPALVHLQGRRARLSLARLDDVPAEMPAPVTERLTGTLQPDDRDARTAIICVPAFGGFGRHLVAGLCRLFPGYFTNFIFVSTEPCPAGDEGQVADVERNLARYVAWARAHDLRSGCRLAVGPEPIAAVRDLCRELIREYPCSLVVAGKPVFRDGHHTRFILNRIAACLERSLRFADIQAVVVPVTVPE